MIETVHFELFAEHVEVFALFVATVHALYFFVEEAHI